MERHQSSAPESIDKVEKPKQATAEKQAGKQVTPPFDASTGMARQAANTTLQSNAKKGLLSYPERYVNTTIVNRDGVKEVALLVLNENDQAVLNIEQALSDLLRKQGVEPIRSFFTPAFIQEGHARALFDGQWHIAQELELKTHIDYLLLGFAKLSYASNPQYEGLWTANLTLQLKCFDFKGTQDAVGATICGTKVINVPGAGYTQETALENAVKGTIPQLEPYIRSLF